MAINNTPPDLAVELQKFYNSEAIARFYPGSSYADSLSSELRERAKQRLFQPPKIGAQVICPHCGAPHAAPPGMDELFFFVCHHCGNSVEVPRARVQY